MKFVVSRIDLGKTRTGIGWVLYDSESKAFEELTPTEVKEQIRKKNVTGLLLDGYDISIDSDFCKDLIKKSGVGNFSLINELKPNTSCIITVVSKSDTEFGQVYEIVTNFCQRIIMDAEVLKSHIVTGIVNGASLDNTGKIVLHDAVERYLIAKPDSLSKESLDKAKIEMSADADNIPVYFDPVHIIKDGATDGGEAVSVENLDNGKEVTKQKAKKKK